MTVAIAAWGATVLAINFLFIRAAVRAMARLDRDRP